MSYEKKYSQEIIKSNFNEYFLNIPATINNELILIDTPQLLITTDYRNFNEYLKHIQQSKGAKEREIKHCKKFIKQLRQSSDGFYIVKTKSNFDEFVFKKFIHSILKLGVCHVLDKVENKYCKAMISYEAKYNPAPMIGNKKECFAVKGVVIFEETNVWY